MRELQGVTFKTPQSIRDAILMVLRKAIINGQLQPNQRITERMLSEHFQTSTMPVKEALRILESEGLIYTIPRKGNFVSGFAEMQLCEIFAIRAAVEGVAANFAAQKANDEEVTTMGDILEECRELLEKEDSEGVIKVASNFHQTLIAASKNLFLIHKFQGVLSYAAIARQMNYNSHQEQINSWEDHCWAFEAIKARQPEEAEKRIRRHILRSGHVLLEVRKEQLQNDFSIQNFFKE